MIVPVSLAVAVLLVLVLIWQWAQGNKSTEPREARAVTRAAVRPTATPLPVAVSTTPATTTVADEPSLPLPSDAHPAQAKGVVDTLAAIESATSANPSVANGKANEVTNATAIAPAPPPKAAPLRLQAIVFDPKRPSALISGKTVFIGDKLGDARVMGIDRDSATLVGAGRTNILTLPE